MWIFVGLFYCASLGLAAAIVLLLATLGPLYRAVVAEEQIDGSGHED